MNERDLRGLIDRVKAGTLSRRGFIGRMAAVGLTAPLANQLLVVPRRVGPRRVLG